MTYSIDDYTDLNLLPQHAQQLADSDISPEVAKARVPRSIRDDKELLALGFAPKQARVPGLLFPLHTTDGTILECVYRPDSPRVEKDKVVKYELKAGQGVRLDCPPVCREQLADPKIPLWLTEGIKKADSGAGRGGACWVALLGVSAFKGKNPFGGVTFLNDWDYIALNGREVRIVFDNDVMRKPEVRKALDRLTEHLQRKGATVRAVYLPLNGPKGVDEYLASGKTLSDLEMLIESPRPQPQAAQPAAELVDDAPLTIRRPLALIDGKAYAAIWPHVKTTVRETLDKSGNLITLNPPKVETKQRLLIIRSDGRIFGDGGDEPLADLGIETKLDTCPPQDRLWSTLAVKAYRNGVRPDPADVFNRVATVYAHYLDFNRSLANQTAMSQFSACLSLMTWLTEVCDVLPYPWPNGDWGTGKTKWGTLWTMTSYLGQILTMGGSFAALRDLADYGAALLFDDAEHLDDKRTDPDKRALLLAGNRRGAQIPLKEPGPDRTWTIRWINAFCPRGFTAKSKPHGALETRALLIPLIKTADGTRGNRDPARVEGWPCSWRKLQDDLWATALMLLPEAKKIWGEFDHETALIGREFEPWRAPLTVARLFERHGVVGLEQDIRAVMAAALQENGDTPRNYETKIVEAIGVIAFGPMETWTVSDNSDGFGQLGRLDGDIEFTAKKLSEQVIELANAEDDTSWATAQGIGYILNNLRVPKKRDASTKKRDRLRMLNKKDVLNMLRAYGLLPLKPSEASEPVQPSEDKQQNAGKAYPPKDAPPSHTNGSNGASGNLQEEIPDPEQEEERDFQGEFHFDSRESETEDAEVLE